MQTDMSARRANYGTRLRIGMLLPSVNMVAEQQIQVMLPPGVSVHTTRLKLAGGTQEQLLAMTNNIEEGAHLLADARADLIVFHCTAASTLDQSLFEELRQRIERSTGRAATTTGHAAISALRCLGADKIVYVCPNRTETHRREVAFFRNHGIDVVDDGCMDIADPARVPEIEPDDFRRLVSAHRSPEAKAYFIGCTAVRSAEAIETLEAEVGQPVLTSNQAMVWHALRMGGIKDRVGGFGTLLRTH